MQTESNPMVVAPGSEWYPLSQMFFREGKLGLFQGRMQGQCQNRESIKEEDDGGLLRGKFCIL